MNRDRHCPWIPTDDVACVWIIACKLHVYVGRCQMLHSDPVEAAPRLCVCHCRSNAHSEALFQDFNQM